MIEIKKIKFNQVLIITILLFTTFSGSIRKWVTNSGAINNLIIAIQVPIIYLFLFLKDNSILKNKTLSFVLISYVLYLFIAAFTPLSPSYYHSIAGIIVHLSFWLGLFYYLNNKENIELDKYTKLILILIVAETILAIFQNQLPRENIVNQYAMEDEFDDEAALGIAMVGDSVRVSGTFSYISGFTAFILFTQLFSFSLFYREEVKKYIPIIGVGISLILALLSGSRSSVFINLILSISFFSFQLKDYDYRRLLAPSIILILLLGLNLALSDPLKLSNFTSSAYDNFNDRLESNQEEGNSRVTMPFKTLIDNEYPNKLIGNGLGISYPAIVALKGTSKVAEKFWVQDDEMGRTLLEGGYILFVFKLILIFTAIRSLQFDRKFAAIMFFTVFFYMTITTNIYNIVFFLIGVVFLEQAIIKHKKTKIVA